MYHYTDSETGRRGYKLRDNHRASEIKAAILHNPDDNDGTHPASASAASLEKYRINSRHAALMGMGESNQARDGGRYLRI